MSINLESRLIELLGNPRAAALQADLGLAAALRQQEVMLRQRAGAAAARLRRAREENEDPGAVAALEAAAERRLARLNATTAAADAADIRRPYPERETAQIFGRATGEIGKTKITAAALSAEGEMLAHAAANGDGVFHLLTKGDLDKVTLQLSDARGRVLHRADRPVSVAAGTVFQIDIAVGAPEPRARPAPGKMPPLIGQSEAAAVALVERLGLTASIRSREDQGPPDIVIAQSPQAGAALKGSGRATLTISRRPQRRRRSGPAPTAPEGKTSG